MPVVVAKTQHWDFSQRTPKEVDSDKLNFKYQKNIDKERYPEFCPHIDHTKPTAINIIAIVGMQQPAHRIVQKNAVKSRIYWQLRRDDYRYNGAGMIDCHSAATVTKI